MLEPDNAQNVARHLVMASQYLDVDPDFALEHALAAVNRAGRVTAVREAAAIAAYVAEDFETALRELRTHRRMSGSNEHLPLIVDAERALGRTEKALESAADPEAVASLNAEQKAELAMVVSGIHRDAGDLDAARKDLEIPELNPQRAFDYSPRLFSAYADVLEEQGHAQEAERWARLTVVAEAALGQGQFAEPEIYEIEVLPDEEPETMQNDDDGVDLGDALQDIEEDDMREDEMPDVEPLAAQIAAEEGLEEEAEAEMNDDDALEVGENGDRVRLDAEDDEELDLIETVREDGVVEADEEAQVEGADVYQSISEEEFDGEALDSADVRAEIDETLDQPTLEMEDPGAPEATDETAFEEEDLVSADATGEDPETEPVGELPPELQAVEDDIARDNRGDAS